MKNKTIWIVGGILAFWAILKYWMASNLEYTFGGISLGAGNILNPQILVSLNIKNPTSTTSTINSVNVSFYSNNTLIGHVNANYEKSIAPNTITQLQLPLDFQLNGLIQDIVTTIKQAGTIIEIKGTVTADLIPLPIDIIYNF